ncbi:MAG: hypothetical protein FJ087_20570 [Deltaproteobacteria bacterium]|nr:hypothetical protein [Deltaproteobacteria bacterium]
MEEVEDLDCVRVVLVREVPDPLGSVGDDRAAHRLVEAAAARLTLHPLRESGGCLVGVAGGDALDGRRVADGPPVATGANERLDLGDDLRVEDLFEPPFLAASFSEAASGAQRTVSAHSSQAFQYASTCFRNSWPAST